MERVCEVFIIGDSLFTETLVRMLTDAPEIKIVGTAPSLAQALMAVPECIPHMIILAAGSPSQDTFGSILAAYPELAIICADLTLDYLQVITSRRIAASRRDLLATIQSFHRDLCT